MARARAAGMVLALAVALAPAGLFAEAAEPEDELKIKTLRRQRLNAEELLGFDRWHKLEAARFDLAVHTHDFTPSLSERPEIQEDLEEVVVRSLLRLGQKSIQREMRLLERRDEIRARVRGIEVEDLKRERQRPGLDVSPRFNAGSQTSMGAKLSLGGTRSRFWRGASLRLTQEIGGADTSVKLSFRDHRRSVYLLYHSDDDKRGEMIHFGIRFVR